MKRKRQRGKEHKERSEKGFTLTELMVVMAIIILLAAIMLYVYTRL